jgi:hypothetical protein
VAGLFEPEARRYSFARCFLCHARRLGERSGGVNSTRGFFMGMAGDFGQMN